MIKHIHTEKAPEAIGPYSQAIIVNNILYTSGQIPLNPVSGQVTGSGIVEQTHQVIANIEAILDAVGSSMASVFKTTCFLADMADFAEFNAVYDKFFVSKPARSCIAVKQLPRNVLIEIEICAVTGS